MSKRTPKKDRVAMAKRVEAEFEKTVKDETEEAKKARVWRFLVRMSDEVNRAQTLTDEQLVDEVFEKLWGELNMDSRESALLEELIDRFKKRTAAQNAPDSLP